MALRVQAGELGSVRCFVVEDESEYRAVVSATLIVLGDNLDPDTVSRTLASFPDQSWRAGEQKRYRDRDGNEHFHDSFHEWGGWKRFIPENLSGVPLEEQLTFWLESLESHAAGVATLLSRGWSVTLDCYFSSETTELLELPAQFQKRLGSLGVDVDIHFFARDSHAGNRT